MRAFFGYWLFRVSLLLLTLAPAFAAAPQGDAAVHATPALWTVHGPKGVAYLFGSVHVMPKNVNWQTPQIQAAMKSADTYVFEVPMDKDTQARAGAVFGEQGLLPFTTSLPALFDSETRADFRDAIAITHANTRLLVYMRPWLAALTLQGSSVGASGFSSEEGVDNKVYAQAIARGVAHFRAFETPEQQITLLHNLGGGKDEMMAFQQALKAIIRQNGKSHGATLNGLVDAWEKGDTKRLAALGPDSKDMAAPERKLLLDDRNTAWVPQIAAMLKERHTYFITVGAAHLVGKGGVPSLLRQAGYIVEGP
jgi:uncharacterized protein YbaP (TraB family)